MQNRHPLTFLLFLFLLVVAADRSGSAQGFGDEADNLYIPPAITVTDGDGREVGIELQEIRQQEWIAPLPILFFDNPGDWLIPDRYVQYASSALTRDYVDTSDVGVREWILGKYYEILNIVGYRMRKHPDAVVHLRGCHSAEGGESEGVAHERALVVREYLARAWDIDTARLPLLPEARRADTLESNPKQQEARRVEFSSTEPAIFAPIAFNLVGHTGAWETLRILTLPNMDPTQVDSLEFLMIGQSGEVYDRTSIPGHPDSTRYTTYLNWHQKRLDAGDPLSLQVRVLGKDGHYRPSDRILIPVTTTRSEEPQKPRQPRTYRIPSGRYGDSLVDVRQQELIRSAAADFERVFEEETDSGYVVLARGVVDLVEDPERTAPEVNVRFAEKQLRWESSEPGIVSDMGEVEIVILIEYPMENGTTLVSYIPAKSREEAEEQGEEYDRKRQDEEEERKARPALRRADTIADARARGAIRFVQDSLGLPMFNADLPEETDLAQRLWGWMGYNDGRNRTDELRRGIQPSRGGAYADIHLRPEHRWYYRGLWMEFWTWGHVERLVDIYDNIYGGK